jgi:hypothetical protein
MKATTHNIIIILISLILIAFVTLYTFESSGYFNIPVSERHLAQELNDLYSSSGLYGHGIGFLAGFFMVLLWLYIIRKHWNRMRGLGRLSQWLKYHMWLGITAPLLAAYHAAFQFDGIIGVMYWAMIAVMLSGIVGRYLYGHIPRRRDGHEMSVKQINMEKASKLRELQMEFGISSTDINRMQTLVPELESKSTFRSLIKLLAFDFTRHKQIRNLMHDLQETYGTSAHELAFLKTNIKMQLVLQQRMVVLDSVHRLFHWWHVIHKPFAYAIFLVLSVHIILTYSFGFTWIF